MELSEEREGSKGLEDESVGWGKELAGRMVLDPDLG
jgi:hypothetical protein